MEVYDATVMQPETAIRAIWLLYKRGRWGHLEDFGIERKTAEPLFKRFEQTNIIGDRLTKAQTKALAALVPGLEEAGKEMRLAYVLTFYERRRKRQSMRHYLGEVPIEVVDGRIPDSDKKAEQLVAKAAEDIIKLGGSVNVGRTFGEGPACVIVTLPDDIRLAPEEFFPGEGIEFQQVGVKVVPAVEDQGIVLD